MNAAQLIKRDIILRAFACYEENFTLPHIDASNIDEVYSNYKDNEGNPLSQRPFELEFREEWDEETKMEHDVSRYYDSKAVAKKLSCGTWVGYTFFYNGGVHGDPGAIDWISNAYLLECKEYEKVIIARDFKKV